MPSKTEYRQDPETMADFFNDFREALQDSENILIDLEQDPKNYELLCVLYRSVHTIKGNLVYVGLKDLTPLIQSVEDLLDAIRSEQLHYDSLLSDLILISMDRTEQMVETKIQENRDLFDEAKMNTLCQTISSVAESTEDNRAKLISNALVLLDPSIDLRPEKPKPPKPQKIAIPFDIESLLTHFDVNVDDDLNFFKSLCDPMENRSLYWNGRSIRLLRVALAMNAKAGNPVEVEQLTAAIFIHDIGMAFLPLATLHKTGSLSADEIENLQGHPMTAYQLLSKGKRWDQAATAVLQHHERFDGTGYPNQLKGHNICDAAKIIAIVNTFEARTHERAYSTQLKRPLIRAVLEINRCSETQFDPKWVKMFNQAIRDTHPTNH